MLKALPFIVAAAIVVGGTWIHATWTNRFVPPDHEKLGRFSARLDKVPKVIGDWEGKDLDMDPVQYKASGVDNGILRVYTNRKTGKTVKLYLVSGNHRPICIHTPDWCYVGAGDVATEAYTTHTIDCGIEPAPKFRTTIFESKKAGVKRKLRLFWAFTCDGAWDGPSDPQSRYAQQPAMFKMYLDSSVGSKRNREPEKSPVNDFVRDAMPTIQAILFPPEKEEADEDAVSKEKQETKIQAPTKSPVPAKAAID